MKQARFEKVELNQILQLYGVMVSQGIWKDYSISFLREFVVFSVYRKNSDWALFSIKKTPKILADGVLDILDACWQNDHDRVARIYRSIGFGGETPSPSVLDANMLRDKYGVFLIQDSHLLNCEDI